MAFKEQFLVSQEPVFADSPGVPSYPKPRTNYKPVSLRPVFLISFAALTLALLGLLEYADRVIQPPTISAGSDSDSAKLRPRTESFALLQRANTTTAFFPAPPVSSTTTPDGGGTQVPNRGDLLTINTSRQTTTTSPAPDLNTGGTTTVGVPNPSQFLVIGATTTTLGPNPNGGGTTTVGVPNQSQFLVVGTTTQSPVNGAGQTITQPPVNSGQATTQPLINGGQTTTQPAQNGASKAPPTVGAPPPGQFLTVSQLKSVTGAPAPSLFLSVSNGRTLTFAAPDTQATTQAPSTFVTTVPPASITYTPTLDSCAMQACSATVAALSNFVAPPASITYVPTTGSCAVQSCAATTVAYSQFISGQAGSASITFVPTTGACASQSCSATVVAISALIPADAVTSGILTTITSVPVPTATLVIAPSALSNVELTPSTYFLASYMPILIAVIFSGLWNVIDTNIKRMEPFYQLNKEGGASAKDSVCLDYLNCNCLTAPYFALVSRQWIVAASSVINLIASLLIPITSSQTIFIGASGDCSLGGNHSTCHGYLVVQRTFLRVIQVSLVIIALAAVVLTWCLWNRESGIAGDPTSIAGLAVIFERHQVLEDIRHTKPDATKEELYSALEDRRYGIMPTGTASMHGPDGVPMPPPYKSLNATGYQGVPASEQGLQIDAASHTRKVTEQNRSTHLHWASISGFGLLLMGLGTLITYYRTHSEETGFERFMSSNSAGPRALFAAVGCLIRIYWQITERDAQMVEPYVQLTRGNAAPYSTILVPVTSTPFETITIALLRNHFYVAIIAFISILAEVLTILLPSIPWKPTLTWMAFDICSAMSLAILATMLLVLVFVFIRRHSVDLPRFPDTIASALTYICSSHMLEDMRDYRTMNGKDRDASILRSGDRYFYGEARGTDGVRRLLVEKESGLAS